MKTQKVVWQAEVFPPNARCSDHVYKFLRKVGGVNPYGENNYLLAIASEVRFLQGGEFWDYPSNVRGLDQGRLEFSEDTVKVPVTTKLPGGGETGFVTEVPRDMAVTGHPLRIVKEMRWVKRWPNVNGWVILHWEPEAGGSTRAWWESWKVKGTDFQIMGPWPEKGMYWMFAEGIDLATKKITTPSFAQIPAFDWMERAIQQFEFNRNAADKIANRDFRMLSALSEARDRQLSEEQQYRQFVKQKLDDAMKPYLGSSLQAGAMREVLAKRIRERTGENIGHVGN